MSKEYGLAHAPKDFEEALRILEGSFVRIVTINDPTVSLSILRLRTILRPTC